MGRISQKKLSRKSKNTSFQREKTFANGNNFLFFSFFVKQKFTNTKKSTSEAWSLTTPLPPISSPFRHLLLCHHFLDLAFYHITIRILWLWYHRVRSGDQLTSNSASVKVNNSLSRVDSKSLHWTCRKKSDGKACFQFCHDITSNGEHACIANTEEKKEKSYHNQCHNQKSGHPWNVFW